MAESSIRGDMGSAAAPTSVSDETSSLKFSNMKSDSLILDMERVSHLADKGMSANSRITLQRNHSRKCHGRSVGEMKTKSTASNESDIVGLPTPSTIGGNVSTLGKPNNAFPTIPTDHHHQITIVTGNIGSSSSIPTAAERRTVWRRSSCRRSWIMDPRKIFVLFATLSSMGSILLIYFTLSNGEA